VLYLFEVKGETYMCLPMPPQLPEVLRAAGIYCSTMTVDGNVYLSVRLPNLSRGCAFDSVTFDEATPSALAREVACAPLSEGLRSRTTFPAEELRGFATVGPNEFVRSDGKCYEVASQSLGCPGTLIDAPSLTEAVARVPAALASM